MTKELQEKKLEEVYQAMDSFLVESNVERSVEQLNKDRHLFAEKIKAIIQEVAEQQREEIVAMIETTGQYEDRYGGGEFSAGYNKHKSDIINKIK